MQDFFASQLRVRTEFYNKSYYAGNYALTFDQNSFSLMKTTSFKCHMWHFCLACIKNDLFLHLAFRFNYIIALPLLNDNYNLKLTCFLSRSALLLSLQGSKYRAYLCHYVNFEKAIQLEHSSS